MYFVLTFFEEGRPDCFVVWVLPSTKYGHRNNCILVADAGSELRQHFHTPCSEKHSKQFIFCLFVFKESNCYISDISPPTYRGKLVKSGLEKHEFVRAVLAFLELSSSQEFRCQFMRLFLQQCFS